MKVTCKESICIWSIIIIVPIEIKEIGRYFAHLG